MVVKKVPDMQTTLFINIGTKKQLKGVISMSSLQPISITKITSSHETETPNDHELNVNTSNKWSISTVNVSRIIAKK